MRAQDAYDSSVSNSKVQLENVLKQIKRVAEAGAFEYLEYKANCSEMTVKSLRELCYYVEIGSTIITILWDFQSICKSRVEKDWVNHTCSIDN